MRRYTQLLAVITLVASMVGCAGAGGQPSAGTRRHPRSATITPTYPVPSDAGARTNGGFDGFCPGPDNDPPNGGLSRYELCNVTIDLPWRMDVCHAGPHRFSDGVSWEGSNAITFGRGPVGSPLPIAYADVDHDGFAETLTTVACNGYDNFVLVLGLTAAGDITVFPSPIDVGAQRIAGTPEGYVQVYNSGFGPNPGLLYSPESWETFRWTGSRWVEVTGVPVPLSTAPVVVPPSPAGSTAAVVVPPSPAGPSR